MKTMLSSVIASSSVSLVNAIFTFVSDFAAQSATTTENTFKARCPCALKVTRMYVKLSAAPGNGGGYTVKVRRNGADTTTAVATITDPATTADVVCAASFQRGDQINLEIVPSVGPAPTVAPSITVVLEVESPRGFPVFGGNSTGPSISADNFVTIRGRTSVWETASARADVVVPIGGYIRNLNAALTASPGTGKSYDYTLLKNGADTALTCNVAGAATSGSSDKVVRVEAGDTLCSRSRPNGAPTARGVWVSYEFVPDVDGQSWMGLGSSVNPSAAAASHNALNGANSAWGLEASKQASAFAGYAAIGLFAKVGDATPPGVGKSWTLSWRRGGVTKFSAVISGLAMTANITGQSDAISDLDLVNFRCDPSGTPAIDASAGMHLSVILSGPTTPPARGLLQP